MPERRLEDEGPTIGEVVRRLEQLDYKIDAVHAQVLKTNGRVSEVEVSLRVQKAVAMERDRIRAEQAVKAQVEEHKKETVLTGVRVPLLVALIMVLATLSAAGVLH